MSNKKPYSVQLNEADQKRLNILIENAGYYGPSDVLRNGVKALYDDEYPPSQRNGQAITASPDNASSETDMPDDLVQKEKKKLEKKEAKTKAKHEQLKEKRSDLLDQLDSHKFTVDNADNLMVKWQHYEKRGENVASWRETHSVEHLHDGLHGMDQYRPSKEKVLETLQDGGDLIQHSEHDEVDAEPQEIKAVKP